MIWNYQRRISYTAWTMFTVWVLLLIALFLPPIPLKVNALDSLFVLDITDSMNATDVKWQGKKVSRIEWEKAFVKKAMLEMPCGSQVGLAVFTKDRSLLLINPVEVCSSYNDLIHIVKQIGPQMAWARSSSISKGLFKAVREAKKIHPHPTVVFISDGHESPPLNPTIFPQFRSKKGVIHGLIVGVGGNDLVPIPKSNSQGQIIGVWKANEVMQQDSYSEKYTTDKSIGAYHSKTEQLTSQKKAHLQSLADTVGFSFLSSPKTVQTLLKAIQAQPDVRKIPGKYDMSGWLLLFAFILSVLVFFPYHLFRKRTA